MRLWSLHPKYLDTKGLVALWREALLAKKVLEGKTRGYKKHPQLIRFKEHSNSLHAINQYLYYVAIEADFREFSFDKSKFNLTNKIFKEKILINSGQLAFEFEHLYKKVSKRAPQELYRLNSLKKEILSANDCFKVIKGEIANWEKL